MALGINTNVASINAQNQLGKSQSQNDQALERLSSGLRINSAADDAAGLAISTRFESQISGLGVAERNAQDGVSFAQTAEGALDEVTNSLQRVRDLAVQASNDTNSASDREALNQEATALIDEIDRIAESTEFNGQNILNGALETLQFQVGANEGQTIGVDGVDSRADQLGSELVAAQGSFTNSELTTFAGDSPVVNGVSVDASGASDADDLVAAINDVSNASGVEASRALETTVDTAFSGTLSTADRTLTINDTDITLANGSDAAAVRDQINEFSTNTGVEAQLNDSTGNVELVDSNGGDIEVSIDDNSELGGLATSTETFEAGIELRTDVGGSISVNSGTPANATAIFGGSGALTTSADTVNQIDISDRSGASSAIGTVDQALDQVSSIRAELGAVQNRFDSTIANIQSTSENLSASNSRILDADFAAESAKLAQSQVLQQAGISVLSQANQRPQQVLSLLQ